MSIPIPQLFKYDASIYLSKANFENEMLKNKLLVLMMPQFVFQQSHKSIEEFYKQQSNELLTSQMPKQSRKRKSIIDIEEVDEDDNELSILTKFPKQLHLSRKKLAEKMLKMLNKPINTSTETSSKKICIKKKEEEKKNGKKFKMQKFTDEDVLKITKFTSEQIIDMSLKDLKKHLGFKSDAYNFASYYVRRRWTNSKSYEKNKDKKIKNK